MCVLLSLKKRPYEFLFIQSGEKDRLFNSIFHFFFQTKTMRRNLTSLFKFTLLCASMVLLTIFLYKTFHYIHPRSNDDNSINNNRVAGAQKSQYHPRQGAFFMGYEKNAKQFRIDWHDYKFIEAEKLRSGVGEQGEPAFLPPGLDNERKQLFDQNGFNALLSDRIALNRSVKDIRHKG